MHSRKGRLWTILYIGVASSGQVSVDPISAEAESIGEGAMGVWQSVLRRNMVERGRTGRECGVDRSWKLPVAAIFADGAIVGGKTVHAKWIIGGGDFEEALGNREGRGERMKRILIFGAIAAVVLLCQRRRERDSPKTPKRGRLARRKSSK